MNNSKPEGQFSGKQGIEEALKRLNAKLVKDVLDRIGHEKLAERLPV